MKYKHYILKRRIEDVFILPFVLIGRTIALFKPQKNEFDIFFFFPFYHTGGAEKVHALITQAFKDKKCIAYFTRKSVDETFLQEFKNSGATIKNVSTFTDNKLFYFNNLIFRGIISGYINKQKHMPVVFNGQCNFGYKISPWIKKDIKQIELIHSFNSFSWIRIPFMPFISSTVMISKVRIENHIEQYKKLNVPTAFANKILYICNGIELPKNVPSKDLNTALKIVYAGRGTPEKRVHLVAAIAEKVKLQNHPIEFIIAGDVEGAIPAELLSYCTLKGNMSNEKELEHLYQQAHILLITSNTEGFPMVVMEAMANGCAIMATPVGDIPVHIMQNKNGYITSSIDEETVVQEMSEKIMELSNSSAALSNMSNANQQYALEHFDIQVFNKKYRGLLLN